MTTEPINETFIRSITPTGVIIYQFKDIFHATITRWKQASQADDLNAVEKNQHIRSLYVLHSDIRTGPIIQLFTEAIYNTPPKITQSVAILTTHWLLRNSFQIGIKVTRTNAVFVVGSRIEADKWLVDRTDLYLARGIAPYLPSD